MIQAIKKRNPEETGKKIIFLIGFLAFLLPTLILILSVVKCCRLETSISHNYFTNNREIFTGILIAIGLMMICYSTTPDTENPSDKKKNRVEKSLARIAAICAILIALFPTSPHTLESGHTSPEKLAVDMLQYTLNGEYTSFNQIIHTASALILFIILSVFCFYIFKSETTKFRSLYNLCGILIWIGILLAAFGKPLETLTTIAQFVFIGETLALFSFGASWMLKGKEEALTLLFRNHRK